MAISIKHDVTQLQRKLGATKKNQVPFALRLTLNQLARSTKKDIEKQINAKVDRPTRYTQRSIRSQNATRKTMASKVAVKDNRRQNTLLEHLFTGGSRDNKRFEFKLRQMGVLPSGKYVVPGKFAPMNSFGNIKKSFINKIVKFFQSASASKPLTSGLAPGVWVRRFSRIQKKSRKKIGKTGSFEFFVVHKQSTSSKSSGKRLKGQAPEPVLLFVDQPRYRKLFDMEKTASNVILRDLEAEFTKAYNRAVATAK